MGSSWKIYFLSSFFITTQNHFFFFHFSFLGQEHGGCTQASCVTLANDLTSLCFSFPSSPRPLFWSCYLACGILVSGLGIETTSLQWKCRLLTTGPPEPFFKLLWLDFFLGSKHCTQECMTAALIRFTVNREGGVQTYKQHRWRRV